MADFNQHRRCDTYCSRQAGAHGSWGWSHGNVHRCANWTANVHGHGKRVGDHGESAKTRKLDCHFAGRHVHACSACGIGRVFLAQLCELTDGTGVRAWGDGDCSSRRHGKSVGRHGRVMERRRFSSRGHGKSVGRHGRVMGRRRFSSAGRVRLGRLRRLVRASVSPRSSLPSAQVDVE